MGTSATQSELAADLEGIIKGLRDLRGASVVTDGVASALKGAEICLSDALSRLQAGEVVDEAEQ